MPETRAGVRHDIKCLIAKLFAFGIVFTSDVVCDLDFCDLDYNELVALRTQMRQICAIFDNTVPSGGVSHRPPREDV